MKKLILVAACFAFVGLSCDDENAKKCDPGQTWSDAESKCVADITGCTTGAKQCAVNNILQICDEGGAWKTDTDCAAQSKVCNATKKECETANVTCTTGAKQCAANNILQICDERGAWKTDTDCAVQSKVCNATKKECETANVTCTTGDKQCAANNILQICDEGGAWKTDTDCAVQGKVCNAAKKECEKPSPTCPDGKKWSELSKACVVDTTKLTPCSLVEGPFFSCIDKTVYQCSGAYYIENYTCTYGTCDDYGNCIIGECYYNGEKCGENNVLFRCNNGQESFWDDCGAKGGICANDKCELPACTSESVSCDGSVEVRCRNGVQTRKDCAKTEPGLLGSCVDNEGCAAHCADDMQLTSYASRCLDDKTIVSCYPYKGVYSLYEENCGAGFKCSTSGAGANCELQ